ncbi:hypothetical protein PFISCL1PPCAC_16487, partial [Pristionchus fissidentatus]
LDEMTPCGSDGYAKGYGLPLCNAFVNNISDRDFDAVGRRFLNCTRECLAKYVRDVLIADHETNCTAIEMKAFDSHVPCYDRCGFC